MILKILTMIVLMSGCGYDPKHNDLVMLDGLIHITSIGTPSQLWNNTNTDQEFKQYIAAFENDFKKVNIPVHFGMLTNSDLCGSLCEDNKVIAQARFNPIEGYKDVVVNKNKWNDATECIHKFVIYHELAHAILLKGHNKSMIEITDFDGIVRTIPNSLMTPELIYEDCDYIESSGMWDQFIKDIK